MSADEVDDATGPGIGMLVLRVLGIAALVIVGSAVLFSGLGQIEGEPTLAADGSEESDAPAAEPDPALPEQPEADTDPEGGAGEGDADGADGDPEPEPDPDPDPDPEPDGDPEHDGDPEPEPDPDPEPEPDTDDDAGDDGEQEPERAPDQPLRIDPGTVSVQVLDGYRQDGGNAADTVAAQLADEGYRIVARNPGLRYDVTAVLWTAGNEEAAKQIARDIGAAELREQPGNLSTQVMVHVVVGADRS